MAGYARYFFARFYGQDSPGAVVKTISATLPAAEFSLNEAIDAINSLTPLACQQIPTEQALAGVNATLLTALREKPSYDQSTRDGYALADTPQSQAENRAIYQIISEVAAGSTAEIQLKPGQAVRIMTGAMVPEGCSRVVPFEVCSDNGETVTVPDSQLSGQKFIRLRGCEIKKGQQLLAVGTRLQPDHLLLLAENGYGEIPVHRKARVAVICTGSELVTAGQPILPGQKISGNGILLSALLQNCGADCGWSVTVNDTVERILKQIRAILTEQPDMIITTGGMGPGKFDLMEQVFTRLGGSLLYNRLQVRPGKSTLFGTVDSIPFFALPGPPPAVRLLFHELITPALNRLHGLKNNKNDDLLTAVLTEPVPLKQTGHLNLKGGRARISAAELQVRPAGRLEAVNAIIQLPDDRQSFQAGERVTIRLTAPLL